MKTSSVRYKPQIDDTNDNNLIDLSLQSPAVNSHDIFFIKNDPTVILPALPEDSTVVRREKFDIIQSILCTILTFLLISTIYVSFNNPNGPFNQNFAHTTIRPVGTTPNLINYTLPKQESCGKPSKSPNPIDSNIYANGRSKRIINGRDAVAHSWPWMVSIQTVRYGSHFCDGALIYDQFVLTAAHCLEDKYASQIMVVVGLHELSDYSASRNQIYYVETFSINEMYDSVNILYDIGIIKLKKKVQFSDTVSTICLPYSENDANSIYNKLVVLAGWGRIDKGTQDILATVLQEAILLIKNGNYPCSEREYDSKLIYCAIDPNKTEDSNACNGDSGGPLFLEINDTWYAYGITSYITGSSQSNDVVVCENDKPSYYTKIALYLNWIAWKISIL